MLAEIDEKSATGEIAAIFADVRRLWGAPFVSAIHRHMATRPGLLEWAWEAVGPAFQSGVAQDAAWRAVAGVAIMPLAPVSRDATTVWGLDVAGTATVKNAAEGFMRVAPVNMVFAALVKALLEGKAPGGRAPTGTWSPPAMLPPTPPLVPLDKLDPAVHRLLLQFATLSGGKPFVPGLYRMIAHWPGLLAHLATVLSPRLDTPDMRAACDDVRSRIDAIVPEVLATLPATKTRRALPDATERAHFLAVGATYRKTSPELVVLGRLIKDAMP